jgi:hypothetical protein
MKALAEPESLPPILRLSMKEVPLLGNDKEFADIPL